MIDIDTVREKYASMPDSELISFANNEGHQLTEEGLNILSNELLSRKLSLVVLQDKEIDKLPPEENDDHLKRPYLTYIFDQKENGKNNAEVISGLLEFGMEELTAEQLLSGIESMAKQRLKKAELELLVGMAILSGGIAITFLPLSMPANRLTYIVAWCAILFGGLRFVKGIYNKSRFKKIIKNMMDEK